jgi:hypothetical protein
MTKNDQIVLCSSICKEGNCTTSWNQRFTVNGFIVFVARQLLATKLPGGVAGAAVLTMEGV